MIHRPLTTLLLAGSSLMMGCGGAPTADTTTTDTPTAGTAEQAQGLPQPDSQAGSLPSFMGRTPPNPEGLAAGTPCSAGDQCQSGICEGQGCGADAKGPVCAPYGRMCTKDLRPYCGCDGQTFQSSGSCPGRPFASRGPCPQ